MTNYRLYNADCLDEIRGILSPIRGTMWDTIFADPPDNIGLKYNEYNDKLPEDEYVNLLRQWLYCFINSARTVWFSFNVKWLKEVAGIVQEIVEHDGNYSAKKTPPKERRINDKFTIQFFTFGQHRSSDFGNNMRPCYRLQWDGAYLDPDAIRVQSERQRMGDKRADPRGRVPGDVHRHDLAEASEERVRECLSANVFDFPRVVGNSPQRRKWHRTQLNEAYVRQCLRMSTPEGGLVLDPFGGTGTVLRVAISEGYNCDTVELDGRYCDNIAAENGLRASSSLLNPKLVPPMWIGELTGDPEKDLPLFNGQQDQRAKR